MSTPGPTSMTFDSLMSDLRGYAERGGVYDTAVEAELQPIINRTERDLADELKIQGYIAPYTSQMQVGEPRIAKPQNWRSTVSINYGGGIDGTRTTYMRARSLEWCRAMYPTRNQLGGPALYADYDLQHWLFLPAPNMTYKFEAVVWRLPPLLAESQQTNCLTEFAPNLLLYRSLQGLFGYLKDLASAQYWKNEGDGRMVAITGEDMKRMVDRAQLRMTS